VGVGKESLNWPKRALTQLIWPILRWWGIEKLKLTKRELACSIWPI